MSLITIISIVLLLGIIGIIIGIVILVTIIIGIVISITITISITLLLGIIVATGVVILVKYCRKINKKTDFRNDNVIEETERKIRLDNSNSFSKSNNLNFENETDKQKRNLNLFKISYANLNLKPENLVYNIRSYPASLDYNLKIKSIEKRYKIEIVDLNNWKDRGSLYYYHYTSLNNAKQILRDRKIIAILPKVKHFGEGVYFTILKPDSTDRNLIENNYIYFSDTYLNKIQCAFAFHKNDLFLKKINDKFNRDVWKHADDIDLNQMDYKIIMRNPYNRCHLNI
jgi:hypothetical protein